MSELYFSSHLIIRNARAWGNNGIVRPVEILGTRAIPTSLRIAQSHNNNCILMMPEAVEVPDNYDEKRIHIKNLIDEIDVTLSEVVRQSGRPKKSQYQYVWQVLDGRPGKVSPTVLDDLEHVLKYFDLWEPMEDYDNDVD